MGVDRERQQSQKEYRESFSGRGEASYEALGQALQFRRVVLHKGSFSGA